MDLRQHQLQVGSRCRVRTEVLAVGGLVVLRPPGPVAAVGHDPGHRPSPDIGPLDVRVTGIDLLSLGEREAGPAGHWVRGLAEVRGTWRGDHLDIEAQTALTSERLQAPVREAVLRRARARPQRQHALEEGPSALLRVVEETLLEHFGPWLLASLGPDTGSSGRPVVAATVVRVVEDLAQWAAELPDGVLELSVWLAPDTSS